MAIGELGVGERLAGLVRRGGISEGVTSKGDIGRNEARGNLYARNWDFYRNTAFEDLGRYGQYIADRNLYRYTRLIYNPVKRMVNFYSGKVYPGRLSVDGTDLPYTIPNAIPFTKRVDEKLREAVAQIWQWSNWQTKMKLMTRYATIAGNCLVEIVDDVPSGKIRYEVIWTEMVKDFTLDGYGNLTMYHLEYAVYDKVGQEWYLYGKKVEKVNGQVIVRYFKNSEVYDYGNGKVLSLPYSFIPAVWVKHKDLGGDFGVDAFDGDYVKLEELNSLATHGLDNLHKNIDPVLVLWTDSRLSNALKEMQNVDKDDYDDRQDFKLLRGSSQGKVDSLVGELVTEQLLKQTAEIIKEIEESNPELQFYHLLRDKQYVSGPGARAMIGDAESNFDEAAASYDLASIKLFQMGVAIGGHRLKEGMGGWSERTNQQQKFGNWDLTSYERDDIGIEISARPLLPWTVDDEAEMMQKRFTAVAQATEFLPIEKLMEFAGITDEAERTKLVQMMLDYQSKKAKIEAEARPMTNNGQTSGNSAQRSPNRSQP